MGQEALTLPGPGGKGTLFANPEKWTGYVMAKEGGRYTDDNQFKFQSPAKNRQIMRHTSDFSDLERTQKSPAEMTERRAQEQGRVVDAVLSMHDQPKATDLKALREEQERLMGTTGQATLTDPAATQRPAKPVEQQAALAELAQGNQSPEQVAQARREGIDKAIY